MTRNFFGTDGVRGIVGRDLTEELVERLGRAFARWIADKEAVRPVLIGRDTRASGPALQRALTAGLKRGGADVALAGVLPTPAVGLLAHELGGAGGHGRPPCFSGAVTASHNPPEYNGVKFFGANGSKLSDRQEEEIEELLDAAGEADGHVSNRRDLGSRYVELVCERFGGPLGGLRVAVDCANGAMVEVAPEAFRRLGAEVFAVGAEPDGHNINVGCGATDLSLVSRVAQGERVDLGVAFDGDGDRVLAVDADGRPLDGDQILAILALALEVDLVAVTTMTNLGFHRLMADRGIRVVTTDVGDRYVLEALRREGGVLGGEQSGHLIYLDGHATGDGLAAALLLARTVAEAQTSLGELASVLPRLPQVRRDVPVQSKELTASIREAVEQANAKLDGAGRVLVRPSGTEPVVRVLAEAESPEEAERLCVTIGTLVARELG